jgi:hypothetical protein
VIKPAIEPKPNPATPNQPAIGGIDQSNHIRHLHNPVAYMKRMLSIAMGIGFLISTIFMAIPSMRDGTSEWADLELPGMGAAYLFWGAVGNSVIVGTAIGWAVNAVVYGLVALVIIGALKIISDAARKIVN